MLVNLGLVGALMASTACVSSHSSVGLSDNHPPHAHQDRAGTNQPNVDAQLAEVSRAHGGAGPWAVAGYRMGKHALSRLGLSYGSFDLEIIHYTPREVQYSCIADGAAAATGASLGKLNLMLADAPAPHTHTVYRNRTTGASVTLRTTAPFAARFGDVPRERLAEAGREVMGLEDRDIFEDVPAAALPQEAE